MNIIEKYGSYDAAKAKKQELSKIAADPQLLLVGKIIKEIGEIEMALLEYRRQHNVYEVGDEVVCKYEHTYLFGDVVLEIAYFRDDLKELGRFVRFTNGNDFKLDALRHATDAEIKAGRRL